MDLGVKPTILVLDARRSISTTTNNTHATQIRRPYTHAHMCTLFRQIRMCAGMTGAHHDALRVEGVGLVRSEHVLHVRGDRLACARAALRLLVVDRIGREACEKKTEEVELCVCMCVRQNSLEG